MFSSPEAITSKFWRLALSKELQRVVSFVAIDEAHLVRLWGNEFRPAYQDLSFLRAVFPSVPIMLLSATLPPSLEFLVSPDIGLRKPYSSISLPLNRSNIFYSVKKKQCLSTDLSRLVSAFRLASCPQFVPETLIFCLSKDMCYSVYVHIYKHIDPSYRKLLGIYHASMSDDGKGANQHRFRSGEIRVLVASSACLW